MNAEPYCWQVSMQLRWYISWRLAVKLLLHYSAGNPEAARTIYFLLRER